MTSPAQRHMMRVSAAMTAQREPPPPEPVTRPMELYINGELVSKWDE